MQMTGKAECMPWDLFVQVSSTKGKRGGFICFNIVHPLIGPDFSTL